MGKDYTKVLSEILITLANINDKLRKIEDNISTNKEQEPKIFKHIVAIKSKPKAKEKTDGKIPR